MTPGGGGGGCGGGCGDYDGGVVVVIGGAVAVAVAVTITVTAAVVVAESVVWRTKDTRHQATPFQLKWQRACLGPIAIDVKRCH